MAPAVTAAEVDKAAAMYLSLKRLIGENQLDAINVKCHYELSQIYGFTACIPLSLLAGEVTCSCEGDVLASVTQLMLAYLSGAPTVYGDINDVQDDRLSFACCGLNPLEMSDPGNRLITRWSANFHGITNSSTYVQGQRVTLARVASKGDRYKLHLTTGTTAPWSPLQELGSPPQPGTDVVLDDSGRWFAENIASNHYAMVFGDYREEMTLLAQMLGMRIVK
jgi:L-fucose isomerase-like protein